MPTESKDDRFAAIDALRAEGPRPDLKDRLMLFGQFIGAWIMDVSFFNEDGTVLKQTSADWMFSWILQGRAVQDVMLFPCREDQLKQPSAPVRTGSTLRYFDPVLDAWRVVWIGATNNVYIPLIARKRAEEILLEGVDVDGSPLQWIFSDIKPDSFRWRGMTSKDAGKTWYMEQEMFGRRRNN